MSLCNGANRGCVFPDNITPRETEQTSLWSFVTR
jgi:hypothetical protein